MAVVLQWVNSQELGLSRSVTSLEVGFGSGYLMGELMHRRGWLEKSAFDALNDGEGMEVALTNFETVCGALEARNVPFDRKVIGKIIMQQRGSAAGLLLKIKEVMEKGKVAEPKKINVGEIVKTVQVVCSDSL